MERANKLIWIEAEQWEDGWDPQDANTDVIVVFPDRSKWIASLFTYQNIQTLRQKNMQTGECMSGAYFWASDMVLIDVVSRQRIEELVEQLLGSHEFETVFTRYPDVELEDKGLYPSGLFK